MGDDGRSSVKSQASQVTVTVIDLANVSLVALLLLVSLFTFLCNDLFRYLSASLDMVPGGLYTLLPIIILLASILGLLTGGIARIIILLSWVMYLPSVLYYSRFDLLSIVIPGGFELLSGSLTLPIIVIAGFILTSGTVAQGSIAEMRTLRVSFVSRGANAAEVDSALGKNLLMVAPIIAASVILSAIIALIVTFVISFIRHTSAGTDYLYLTFTIAGAALIALVIMTYLWSKRV